MSTQAITSNNIPPSIASEPVTNPTSATVAAVIIPTGETLRNLTPASVQSTTTPAIRRLVPAATHPQSAPKKLSPQQKQYSEAIAMSSADLGAILKKPSERISKLVGKAIDHEEKAKDFRKEAQKKFDENIARYYEVKQRLCNPGYRTDVDGGKDRTANENQENFGAPDWATFNKKCAAYSLQHADRKLKAFAKEQGLHADDGVNIDDPEAEEQEEQKKPDPDQSLNAFLTVA